MLLSFFFHRFHFSSILYFVFWLIMNILQLFILLLFGEDVSSHLALPYFLFVAAPFLVISSGKQTVNNLDSILCLFHCMRKILNNCKSFIFRICIANLHFMIFCFFLCLEAGGYIKVNFHKIKAEN